MTIPVEHLDEAQKLEAIGIASLYEVELNTESPAFVRFRSGPSVTWQGKLFEKMGCILGQDSNSADEQVARPQLTIQNPDNIWGPFVDQGITDLAIVRRFRVMHTHLAADVNIFARKIWLIGRCVSLNASVAVFELRSPLDTPNFMTPARRYTAEEFPFVTYGV
jgi:phage-related protein